MSCSVKYFALVFMAVLLGCFAPLSAQAEEESALPASVSEQVHAPLMPVGSGTYRKFGFSVYRATLWAPDGVWNPKRPYALELHYTREVSKETMVDTVVDDIREQRVADDATMAQWKETLNAALPAVAEDDVIIGLAIPGKKSLLFFNGQKIAGIDDLALSHAFFNIWLGEHADEDLRGKLLASAK